MKSVEYLNLNKMICQQMGPKLSANEASLFEKCLYSIANVFIQKEEFLNKLDKFSGEGDTGSTLRNFSECMFFNLSIFLKYRPAY